MCHESCMPSWIPGVGLQEITCNCGHGYFTIDRPPRWVGGDLVRQKRAPTKEQYYKSIGKRPPRQKKVYDADDKGCPQSRDGDSFDNDTLRDLAAKAEDLYSTHQAARAAQAAPRHLQPSVSSGLYGHTTSSVPTSKQPVRQFLPAEGLEEASIRQCLSEISNEPGQVQLGQYQGRKGFLITTPFNLTVGMIAEMKRRSSHYQPPISYQASSISTISPDLTQYSFGSPRPSEVSWETPSSQNYPVLSSASSDHYKPHSYGVQLRNENYAPNLTYGSSVPPLEEHFAAMGLGQESSGQEDLPHGPGSEGEAERYESNEGRNRSRHDNSSYRSSRSGRERGGYYHRR